MLHQMKMTDRQKRGDVQHLLARSFSVKNLPSSPLHSPTGGGLPGEIFIPVPQLLRQSSSSKGQGVSLPTLQEKAEEDIVSIGELSVEPGVAGVARQQDQDDGGEKLAGSFETNGHRNNRSSSASTPPEEQSVNTQLLETADPTKLPTLTMPGVRHYDDMFTSKSSEEHVPLGASADNFTAQP